LQHSHPVFRRRRWFQGRPIRGKEAADIHWFKPSGEEMSDRDWQTGYAKSIGVFLNGKAIPSPTPTGKRIIDNSFCVIFNAHWEPVQFTLPRQWSRGWTKVLDTAENCAPSTTFVCGKKIQTVARSIIVFQSID
jgi:glycogen operon protein